MKKGLFIVVEGIDGSGKGTQTRLLQHWLEERGLKVYTTKEPTNGRIGSLLRQSLKAGCLEPEVEALLFAADRKEHSSLILKELNKGRVVVSDRYLPSSLAYQGAHGLDIDWIKKINHFAIKPDVTFILDLTPENALERINSRGREMDYLEAVDFLKRVRDIYLREGDAVVIDASKDIEEIHSSIIRVVERFV